MIREIMSDKDDVERIGMVRLVVLVAVASLGTSSKMIQVESYACMSPYFCCCCCCCCCAFSYAKRKLIHLLNLTNIAKHL